MSSPTNISDGITQSGVPAFKLIQSHLSRVRKLIDQQMTGPAEAGNINKLLEYFCCRSSKMIRPALTLLAGKCCGKITEEHIRIAAIIEIIHNATLLHDGVIAEGREHYSNLPVNNIYSNETSVLLGDFLLGRVFQMCAELKPKVNEIIAGAAVRICEGQLRHIAQRNNWQLTESEYFEIITEKNAVLFSTACRLGALLAKGTNDEVQSLAEYGMNVGIVYQITDDLLGLIGIDNDNEKIAEKNDDKSNLNLAVIHLLNLADEKEKEIVINSCSERKDKKGNKNVLAKLLRTYGSLEYVRTRARSFAVESIETLGLLKESDAKKALIETVKFIADRTI